MGRGKNWDAEENCVLARAWIAASEDPIAGTDQTRKIFQDTVRRRFIENGPEHHLVPEGKYGNRTAASIKQHFSDISADVQKFFISLGKVRACNPTGVGDDEVLSMAVAVHLEHTNRMDYDYKNFVKDTWVYYRAWKVLRNHPKWSCSPTTASSITATQERQLDETQPESSGENSKQDSDGREIVTPTKTPERYGLGTRGAKIARQEELRTKAVRILAESAKRKSDVLEERNAIAAFSRPEAASLPETAQFFSAIRATYLAQALKRAKVAQAEARALGGESMNVASDMSTQPCPPSDDSMQRENNPVARSLANTDGAVIIPEEI